MPLVIGINCKGWRAIYATRTIYSQANTIYAYGIRYIANAIRYTPAVYDMFAKQTRYALRALWLRLENLAEKTCPPCKGGKCA